jgi:hypothetical protein
LWKEVQGWQLGVDESIANGCFMATGFQDGTVLRAQFNPADDTFDMLLFNERWASIEAGKIYGIAIEFEGRSPWTAEAEGRFLDDLPGIILRLTFDDSATTAAFIDEFKRMPGMVVSYAGRPLTRLSLNGTFAAVSELEVCQAALLSEREAQGDPFLEGGGGEPSDPFRP